MHVIATAGHVDHGKSTLVRRLTGMEPDRWAEERRRGLTIDLGFAWTSLTSLTSPARLLGAGPADVADVADLQVAFVDVPGHERFVPNMLAGVGPVPAVLFVVAADGGWMPQSQEHLDALDALGVRHGLLAVTRSDLAAPEPAIAQAQERLRATTLGELPAVAVSGTTGAGLPGLRSALAHLVTQLPAPDLDAPVRLWVDRAFTMRGSGTVVTGTLPAGTLHVGDELTLGPGGRRVRVRGLQALGRPSSEVAAVARVAVNLRGVEREDVHRGVPLLTPDRWLAVDVVDVRLASRHTPEPAAQLPADLVLHIGAAEVPARVRPLGADTARLTLATALPLQIGDRALLRDPGAHAIRAVTVLDVRPPGLRRRGAAAARAGELAALDGTPDGAAELRRRGILRAADLAAMGAALPPKATTLQVGEWLLDREHASRLAEHLAAEVRAHAAAQPLAAGLPIESARATLDLPDARLVAPLSRLAHPPLELSGGRVRPVGAVSHLPAAVERAISELERELRLAPFGAPDAARLAALRLGPRELAAAVRAGRLLAVADGVVLLPDAVDQAVKALGELPQPFTTSDARRTLGTTRRVAVPLLELLDRTGVTARLPDSTRHVRVTGRS